MPLVMACESEQGIPEEYLLMMLHGRESVKHWDHLGNNFKFNHSLHIQKILTLFCLNLSITSN
jgi:hypothetical protein